MSDATQAPSRADQLYGRTELLSHSRHRGLGLSAKSDYGFARGLLTVPATLSEIVVAQRNYPVVFAGVDAPFPVIVLGLMQSSGNLFVDAGGAWAAEAYVPAFIRRYPFIAVPKPGTDELALAVDTASAFVSDVGPQKFFEDGGPTESSRRALEFCIKLHADFDAAQRFGAAVKAAGLLREQRADLDLGATGRIELTNFLTINEGRLDAMDDADFLEWRRLGWLAPAHAHLMATASWAILADRETRRAGRR